MGGQGERRLQEIGARQLGLVTAKQCIEAGLSNNFVQRRIATGAWQWIHRGVFKAGIGPPTQDEADLAALLRAGPEAVLCGQTAARRLGLDVPSPSKVQVMIPWTLHGPMSPEIEVWRTRDLVPQDVMHRGPFRITRPGRTILDLASVLDSGWLRAALDSALRLRSSNLEWIRTIARQRGSGHAGAARLQLLLAEYARPGEVPDSAMESLVLDLLDSSGRRPVLHHRIRAKGRLVAEVDLAWPKARLCVELDSWRFHGSLAAFRRDRARDRALVALGWTVLRYTWEEITAGRDHFNEELRHALKRCQPG